MHKKLHIQTIRWIVASVTFFVGVIDLVLGPDRIEYPTYVSVLHLSSALDSILIALLFYASIGLIIGRRRAWYAALIVLGITAIWMTVESDMFISPLSLIVILSMAIVAATKRYYPIRGGNVRGIRLRSAPLIFTMLTTAAAIGVVMLAYPHVPRHAGPLGAVLFTLETMYTASGIFGAPLSHGRGTLLLLSLSLVGAVNYVVIALALLKPVSDYFRRTPAVQRDVRTILELYASSSEDYFKYFPFDKSYYFAHSFDGFIAYGIEDGVCIALADPIAPNDKNKRELIVEFRAFCEANGWQLAFIPVEPQSLALYDPPHFKRIKIGENAIITIPQYAQRPIQKNMRNILNRFGKAGYTASFVDPHDATVMRQLREVSESWLTHRNHKEHGFAMAHFDESYLHECAVFALRSEKGVIEAFVNQQPNYSATRQTSIDMIRSRSDAKSNTMDMLFHQFILELNTNGWQTLDLGLAPLSGLHDTSKISERGLNVLYHHANWWYSFVGLRRFKNKFHPEWSSRYLLFTGPVTRIPVIARTINKLLKSKG